VTPEGNLVVEVCGEGKTDVGDIPDPGPPTRGVVPILVHTLCGRPEQMLVKTRRLMHLQGKTLRQKVWFAKREAHDSKSDAAIFVIDSEASDRTLPGIRQDLEDGRDAGLSQFAMAVGVAQPCIESWLLADAAAIRRALGLSATPAVPDRPEELPAPCRDESQSPKSELARIAGSTKKELSTEEKDRIATAMNDMRLPRERCPGGFAPFADEVENRIRPLF